MTSRTLIRNSALLLCTFAFTRTGFAQDPPVVFEQIPQADLALTSCPGDSSADALILADYGQSRVNDELGIDFERLLRVKLFRKAAFDEWGSLGITLWTKNSGEHLRKLEGSTYSLGTDGTVVKTELNDDAIFKEKADANRTRYRLTMPALTPGCIVEIHYKIIYNSADDMPEWWFQYSIPCRWSEYRITYPRQLLYAIVTTSFIKFSIDEQTEISQRFRGRTSEYIGSGGDLARCQYYRLAMRDLPALKEEPYITTMADYTPRVQIQLAAYAHPAGAGIERVMMTWEKVVEDLLDNRTFGKQLKPGGTVRDLAARIAGPYTSKLDKLKALYDYVRTSIVWNREYHLICSTDPDDVLAAKRGTSAEVNFLLMQLLAAADIETHPVALSTRGNGKIIESYSLVDQFNDAIAQAVIDGKTYYLDATDASRPYDILPEQVLNVRGLVVREKEGDAQWVTLTWDRRATRRAQATVSVDSAGQISGTLESLDEDYSALRYRHLLQDKKPLEIARTMFDAASLGISIDSAWVAGEDSIAGPLHIGARIAPSPYAQANGDFLYVNPSIIDRTTASPFKRPTRAFPVEMAYGVSNTTVSVIHIPDGYEVKEYPAAMAARVGSSDAMYTRVTSQEGNTLTTISRVTFSRIEFPQQMYASLKDFYDKIVNTDASVIVLKKKPAPVPPAEVQKKPRKPGKVTR